MVIKTDIPTSELLKLMQDHQAVVIWNDDLSSCEVNRTANGGVRIDMPHVAEDLSVHTITIELDQFEFLQLVKRQAE